jgi:membrane protease YdiL (CAAX protease family)
MKGVMMNGTSTSEQAMTGKTLLAFFAITFALAWGLLVAFIAIPQLQGLFGPLGYTNPLYFLMVWAPAFAGVGLVARHHGLRGVGGLLRRLTIWRVPAAIWAFLLLGLPAIFYIGATIAGTFPSPLPFASVSAAIAAIATAFFLGPVEELGWRGVALPLLQRRFSPFTASLILGAFWALWHVPAFFIGTPMSGFTFGSWVVGVMAITMTVTALFNASRGSLLIAYVFHFQLMNPIFPDAQPWDSVLLALVAIIVVVANRKKMFSPGTGASDVMAPSRSTASEGRLYERRIGEELADSSR